MAANLHRRGCGVSSFTGRVRLRLTNQAQRRGEDGAGRAEARTVTISERSLQRLVRPMWEDRLHSDADDAETQLEISS